MKPNEAFNDELGKAEILASIDPRQKYFIYPQSYCDVKYGDFIKRSGAFKCTTLSPSDQTLRMLKMQNGGIPLDTFVRRNAIEPVDFLRLLRNVVEGANKLRLNGWVHHDLKFNNILVDPKTNECKIIDFGLMIPLKKAFTENAYIRSRYWLHPPEYRFYVHLTKNNWETPNEHQIRLLMSDDIKINDHKFSSEDKATMRHLLTNTPMFAYCEYENALMSFFKQVHGKKTEQQKQNYFESFASKIDVYSLGIDMLYLSSYLKYAKTSKQDYEDFMSLVKNMIHPNPAKRLTLPNVLKRIDKIISK